MSPSMTQSEPIQRPQYSLEEKFQACVDIIHSLPKTGPAPVTYVAQLAMYGLYKQVTIGPCNTSKPGIWNPEGRAKWDAWTKLGNMSREEAMELYVACALEAIDVGSETLDWNEILEKYSEDYNKFEPILREKFRILNRELIKEDGTKERRARNGPTDLERLCAGPYTLEEKFQASVDIMRSTPKGYMKDIQSVMSQGDMGQLAEVFTMYALFKQATVGPCNTDKPFWNIVERYKWNAWRILGDTNKEQAMAGYVVGVLEKIDYYAMNFDWNEMLEQYAEDYEKLEPILREKFRILDRELIKEDGKRVKPSPFHNRICGILSFNFDRFKQSEYISEIRNEQQPSQGSPVDHILDSEYCEVREDDQTISRPSSSSLEDPEPKRVKKLKKFMERMDAELRVIKETLNILTSVSEDRHQSIIKLFKRSPRFSWMRSLFFFLVWPLIFHWALTYFGGPKRLK